jgi:hypothetical protein
VVTALVGERPEGGVAGGERHDEQGRRRELRQRPTTPGRAVGRDSDRAETERGLAERRRGRRPIRAVCAGGDAGAGQDDGVDEGVFEAGDEGGVGCRRVVQVVHAGDGLGKRRINGDVRRFPAHRGVPIAVLPLRRVVAALRHRVPPSVR